MAFTKREDAARVLHLRPKATMAITITLSRTVSPADHLRVEELVSNLKNQEGDFKGRAISLAQGSSTFVVDSQDGLRGALLQLMVESVLEDADNGKRAI